MIGDNIKFYRKKNQLTQDDIAEACNVTRQAVSKWENGESLPTVDNLSDIAKLDAAHQERKKSSASAAANTASKNKFNNFTQRSYDYDELEQMLLTTNVH